MKCKNIFISFDYDNDKDIKGSLSHQLNCLNANDYVNDLSLDCAIDEKWKRYVRNKISNCDGVIFLCGRNINDCNGVSAEMSITQELKKPYILLKGRNKGKMPKPRNSYKEDSIIKWSQENIIDFIENI